MTLHPIRALAVFTAVAIPATAGAVLPATAAAASRAPTVEQMVVFKSGRAVIKRVKATGLTAKVGSRRCAVGTATPLAALLRGGVGTLGLRDYASCSSNARDGGQIYVRSIGADKARGASGWVYKVGNRSATSGAADISGPFGSGLLRGGQRVTWYYGTQRRDSFQRTLTLRVKQGPTPATATAAVRSYDNDGKGRAEPGVTIASGSAKAVSDSGGNATLTTGVGSKRFFASKPDLIRSFAEKAAIR